MNATQHPLRVLVTAGPTYEPIDAVRFIGNRSSGRMGVAIANEAAVAGHRVTLLFGPGAAPAVNTQTLVRRFQSAADLQDLLRQEWPQHDLLVMAAAVADFRPVQTNSQPRKLRRSHGGLSLSLEPTPDLVAEAAIHRRPGQMIIGFALEPESSLEADARAKLKKKGIDAIVGNPLETMESDQIAARLFTSDGEVQTPPAWPRAIQKQAFARWLIEQVETLMARTRASAHTS